MRKTETQFLPWSFATKNLDNINIKPEDRVIIAELIKTAYINQGIEYDWIGTRKRSIVEANAVLTAVLLENFRISLMNVGKIFGKHHSTVLHYRSLYEEQLCMYNDLVELHAELSTMCFATKHSFSKEVAEAIGSNDTNTLKKVIRTLKSENAKLFRKLETIKKIVDVSEADFPESNNV
jgi:hypothetical protein